MAVEHASEQLADSLRKLAARWEAVCEGWDDAVRREFERRYIAPLDGEVGRVLDALGRLETAIEAARSAAQEP